MGAFWSIEAKTALALRTTYGASEVAPGFGVGLRAATLLTLIDAELSVLVSPLPDGVTRTRLALELRLHPLFVRQLQVDLGSRILAGIHLGLGLGPDFLAWRGGSETAFALGVGLGVDLPLTNPARHDPSVWLTLGWRFRIAGYDSAPAGLGDMDEHLFLLQLGVRFHDIDFMRLPRPPELDDRDR